MTLVAIRFLCSILINSWLANVQAADLTISIYYKSEMGFKIAPLIAVKFPINIQAVILYFIDAGEAFMAKSFFKETFEVHFMAIVKKRHINSK